MSEILQLTNNLTGTVNNLIEIIHNVVTWNKTDKIKLAAYQDIVDNITNSEEYTDIEKAKELLLVDAIIKGQDNCVKILEQATEQIDFKNIQENVEKVGSDWFSFYFDKAKLVSDDTMQKIWADILSEEINSPNSVSKILIQALSLIDKRQAETFCNICRFCLYEVDLEHRQDLIHPFVYISSEPQLYRNFRITWGRLKDLEYLGLICCDSTPGYVLKGSRMMRSGFNIANIQGDPDRGNMINVGNVMFTSSGRKLYDIIGIEYKEYKQTIFDMIIEQLNNHGCEVIVTNCARVK